MPISIVIPTFNRRSSLLRCINSLLTELGDDDFIIIINAGSEIEINGDFPEKKLKIQVVNVDSRNWWTGSINIGVDISLKSGAEYVLIMNDDNVAVPGLLHTLRKIIREHPRSVVSSIVCYMDSPGKIFFAGRNRSKWTDRFFYLDQDESVSSLGDGIREVDLLHGMCTLIPRTAFEEVGQFDENVFPHLFADDDFILRARKSGYRALVALNAQVMNDRETTGINPYQRRTSPRDWFYLLTSRKSVFQLTKRTKFLLRHRRNIFSFLVTFISDYLRLGTIILAGWILPSSSIHKLKNIWRDICVAKKSV